MPSNTKKDSSESNFEEKDNIYNTTTEVSSENVRSVLGGNADFVCRVILINDNPNIPAVLSYIEGLVDNKIINDNILKPLAQQEKFNSCETDIDAASLISMGTIYLSAMKSRTNMKGLIDDMLAGGAALIFDKSKTSFTFGTKSQVNRAVSEPTTENVIKGPKDSFVESLRTNTALCRQRFKSPYLTVEEIIIGKQSKTTIAIVYLKNTVNNKLIDEVRQRIKSISTDAIISTGSIEEFIVDDKYSTFPQVMFTERPDRFCVGVAEGRVGVIIEGLPTTYIIPGTLLQFIQTPDDYSYQFIIGSILRFMRFLSMFITLVLPGFYICITTFHPEMLPTELTFSIIAAKEGVPFPMFVEVIVMLLAFELLVEAGLRLPKTIGQTVSIVGALVVGQSAVEAKLLSPATVVIIAITAIAGFTMPNQDFSNALRLWRFILVILSSIIGIFGLTFGLIFLLYHWCKMESYGVPYLDPFVANEDEQLQDTLFRLPMSTMQKRPTALNTNNKKRME